MTPFETEIRVNPELQPGETKVLQEGTPGEIKHTVNVTVNNGEVSKEESSEEISKPSPASSRLARREPDRADGQAHRGDSVRDHC
ncbi:G5 domain-containing protein [Corynebacterium jeikeium]|uniref:G5 domain-containing protein n=1 Tax=Corynebacterium jeikeium TaxID=38289 RepID=UPI00351AB8B7